MKRITLIFLLSAGLVLSVSCVFLSSERSIRFILPTLPSFWRERLRVEAFEISFLDSNGELAKLIVRTKDGGGEIRVQKAFVIPVMARPLVPGFSLPPAGGLYPVHENSEGELTLSWEEGLVSGILLELACMGIDLDGLNTERLAREIETRAGDDPFRLDRLKIIDAIASGSFRVTSIRTLPEREVRLVPGPGQWITESPFSPLFETGPETTLELILTHGFHHLLNLLSKEHFDILVEEREVTVLKLPF